ADVCSSDLVEGGTVRFAGVVAGRGVVSVLHPDGLISTYEPVTAEVSDGQAVEEGESLGVLETADAADPHCTGQDCLHLGARQAGAYLDPLPLLGARSEEHTSELQSRFDLVCRLLLE